MTCKTMSIITEICSHKNIYIL